MKKIGIILILTVCGTVNWGCSKGSNSSDSPIAEPEHKEDHTSAKLSSLTKDKVEQKVLALTQLAVQECEAKNYEKSHKYFADSFLKAQEAEDEVVVADAAIHAASIMRRCGYVDEIRVILSSLKSWVLRRELLTETIYKLCALSASWETSQEETYLTPMSPKKTMSVLDTIIPVLERTNMPHCPESGLGMRELYDHVAQCQFDAKKYDSAFQSLRKLSLVEHQLFLLNLWQKEKLPDALQLKVKVLQESVDKLKHDGRRQQQDEALKKLWYKMHMSEYKLGPALSFLELRKLFSALDDGERVGWIDRRIQFEKGEITTLDIDDRCERKRY